MNTKRVAIMAALVACVLWGFYGYFSRNLVDAGYDATQIAGLRLFVAVLMMAVMILVLDRKLFKVRARDLPVFFAFAFVVLAENVFYNLSIERIPLAIAELMQMTSPYFVMIFAFFIFRDIPTVMKIVATAIALLGGALVTGAFSSEGATDMLGFAYAILSGIMLALCGIGMKIYSRKGYNTITLVFWAFLFAAIITVPLGLDLDSFRIMFSSSNVFALVLGLGLIVTVLPYVLQAWSIGKMDVTIVSILSVSQCVFAAIVGAFYFSEILTAENIIGMAIVMSSLVMHEISDLRVKKRSTSTSVE